MRPIVGVLVAIAVAALAMGEDGARPGEKRPPTPHPELAKRPRVGGERSAANDPVTPGVVSSSARTGGSFAVLSPSGASAAQDDTAQTSLSLELARESLTGTHYRYRRMIDGVPLLDDFVVTREPIAGARQLRAGGGVFAIGGTKQPRRVRESIVRDELGRPIARYRDEHSGAVVLEKPLSFDAKPARIFDPNPVVTLNDPTLRDRNDSAAAVPDAAYRVIQAEDALASSSAVIVEAQAPIVPPADASGSLLFDRSESGFEDVNAWFHVDRSQKHLQSLGYEGARQVVPYAIPIDTHATGGADTSYFVPTQGDPGRGSLYFGIGGTDDAEDADLVIHEYGHAILEWISPGTFAGTYGSQARAFAEAFTDYWAFSTHYAQRRASGRDPFCFADWDARCWEDDATQNCGYAVGTECLRRFDVRRTMSEYSTADTAGTEHWNGQIFAGALVDLFLANVARYGVEEGRKITDTLIIEALFDTPPSPVFATIAQQIGNADRLLYGGAHLDTICAAMSLRGIFTSCGSAPRGELTQFQSAEHGVGIPDGDPRGIEIPLVISDRRVIDALFVRVDLAHPSRGDLRLELIAPDGTLVVLQRPSLDAAADVRTTFGRDVLPEESLDVLRGRSAAGTWRLRVADTRMRDAGTIESWSLILRFEGDTAIGVRPQDARERVLPVVAHVSGVNGTQFRSDVRILNASSSAQRVTLVLTPSGVDGRRDFAAMQLVVAPRQLIVLRDVVRSVFATAGSGSLTVIGDVIVTSRTWTPIGRGTAGQSIAPAAATTRAELFLVAVDARSRTNVGVVDAAGSGATVRVTLREDVATAPLSETSLTLPPFGHLQVPAPAGSAPAGRMLVAVVESSAPVYAYASVVSNVSGDAMYVADEESKALPAISANGANGTLWKTTLAVVRNETVNPGGTFAVSYTSAATGVISTINVPGGDRGVAWISDDAVRAFGAIGSLGVVRVAPEVNAGLRAAIFNGVYGTGVPALRTLTGTAYLAAVESYEHDRTNVGLFSEGTARARVTIRDAAGTALSSREVSLEPLRLVQFEVLDRVVGGYATVDVLSGAVRAYASVVDHETGDSTIVAAQE